MVQPKGLGKSFESFAGKGLEALFGSATLPAEGSLVQSPGPTGLGPHQGQGFKMVSTDQIAVNRDQPRTEFDSESLKELAQSVAKEGILQPLVVTPLSDGRYELVAGERRLRAARMSGLAQVPVWVRDAGEEQRLKWALVENIQREDLNPIEEAKGYQTLSERFGLTQADIAEKVGKSREHVANSLRLLNLPKLVQEDVAAGKMSAGHARALLALPELQDQLNLRERILSEMLTVRDVETMIQSRAGFSRKKKARTNKMSLSPQTKLLLDNLQKSLGTKVRFQPSAVEGRGQIVIWYFSSQDLNRICREIVD